VRISRGRWRYSRSIAWYGYDKGQSRSEVIPVHGTTVERIGHSQDWYPDKQFTHLVEEEDPREEGGGGARRRGGGGSYNRLKVLFLMYDVD